VKVCIGKSSTFDNTQRHEHNITTSFNSGCQPQATTQNMYIEYR